jgi:hypothetical protein
MLRPRDPASTARKSGTEMSKNGSVFGKSGAEFGEFGAEFGKSGSEFHHSFILTESVSQADSNRGFGRSLQIY